MTSNSVRAADLGALFMVGLPGLELDDSTQSLIQNHGINNFILFKRNVAGPQQLRSLCKALYSACLNQGLKPPLISIDQEGGTVTRLPPPFTQFPDARILAESNEPEMELRQYARTCVRELRDVGINMNLSPVLDVCPTGQGYFMERRSLGGEPGKVARLGSVIIEQMQQGKLAACAKHFPGLGSATLDPHEQLPVVVKKQEELRAQDFVPFQKAIQSNVAAVMTSHTIYINIDPDRPATLSPIIFTDILRAEMGYQGLVITDDLEMGAIENEWSAADAAVQAFKAGADLMLICHEHDKVIEAFTILESAVIKGEVSQDRMMNSLNRVAMAQMRYAVD